VWRHLLQRLASSLDNDAERRIFNVYAQRYRRLGGDITVLLPQVYLSYDQYPQWGYGPGDAPLKRQRMDFLLLFPGRFRVVIECNGVQHYADDPDPARPGPANVRRLGPRRYAEMVVADRALRLRGTSPNTSTTSTTSSRASRRCRERSERFKTCSSRRTLRGAISSQVAVHSL
jgi:hypothetical protein